MAIKTWFWNDGYIFAADSVYVPGARFTVDNIHVPGAWKMYKTLCKIQKFKTFKV